MPGQSERQLLVARAAIWRDTTWREILVGQRPSTAKNYPNHWELPGGKFEPGETPTEAVVRELQEETPRLPTSLLYAPIFIDASHHHHDLRGEKYYDGYTFVTHFFQALVIWEQVTGADQASAITPIEHQHLFWLTIPVIRNLILIPQTDAFLDYLEKAQPTIENIPHHTP